MAKPRSRAGGTPQRPPLIGRDPSAAIRRLQQRVAEVAKLDSEAHDDPRFDDAERNIRADVKEIFGEDSPEDIQNWNHEIFYSNQPDYLCEPDDPYIVQRQRAGRKAGIERTRIRLESLIAVVNERTGEIGADVTDNVKFRNHSGHPSSMSTIVHNYHNSGQVAAMGPNAHAIGNTMIVQNTQQQMWNDLDRGLVAAELGKLRAELITSVADGNDPDDAIELGNVGHAAKALTLGDKDGFFGALKKFGSRTWNLAERLGLEWFQHEARTKLALPPSAT